MHALAKRVLPPFLWNGLSRVKYTIASPVRVRKYMDLIGYNVALKSDYYSPLTSAAELRSTVHRWNRPSALNAVRYDIEQMKNELSDLLSQFLDEFSAIPPYKQLQQIGFGPGYTAVDALTLYMMIRHLKPRRYIEVGAGLSTYYCSLAAERNAAEGRPVHITCIEPNPYAKLFEISGISVIPTQVQEVDLSVFQELEADDVLFIDSSHVVKIDGDVPFLYLEVLPVLKVGTVVHVHELWVLGDRWTMQWNEAMLVQAFLCFNSAYRIVMSTPLIRHVDESFLASRIPFYESIHQNPNTFSSLWVKRVS